MSWSLEGVRGDEQSSYEFNKGERAKGIGVLEELDHDLFCFYRVYENPYTIKYKQRSKKKNEKFKHHLCFRMPKEFKNSFFISVLRGRGVV